MRASALTLLLCVAPSLLCADSTGPSFAERVEVELVLVELFALGADGAPVLDLEPEELRLFHDGEPVEIAQFTPPAGRPGEPAEGRDAPLADAEPAPRRVVVFIDELHLAPGTRRRTLERLAESIGDLLAPADEVMVVSHRGRAEVVLPMSRDRRALRAALRERARASAVSLLADGDSQRALETIAAARALWAEGSADGGAACRDVGHLAEAHARQVEQRVLGTIAELERFVRSLAGFPGPKLLLHVSDGVPLVPGAEAYRFASELCDGTGAAKGVPNAIDTTTSTGLRNEYWDPTRTWATLRDLDTGDAWARLAGHANTYQVAFHTYQARQPGNRSASVEAVRTSLDVEAEARRNLEEPLFLLADETGGATTLAGGDVARALGGLVDAARHGYQLAYVPPRLADGRLHRIRVEASRPGVTLRHRRSYRSKEPDERIADRLLGVLLHGRGANPLAARLEIDAAPRDPDGSRTAQVRVRVPLSELVMMPAADRRNGLFTVFVAVRDADGATTPVGHRTLPLMVPVEEAEERSEFTYAVEVPMAGEEGWVAVGVRDEIGGEVSFLRGELRAAR